MTFKNPKSNISYKYAIVALIIIVIIIITSLVLDTQQGSDLKSNDTRYFNFSQCFYCGYRFRVFFYGY